MSIPTSDENENLKYTVLDAVKYRFKTELRKKLMEAAEEEVSVAIANLTSEIDWNAAMQYNMKGMSLDFFIEVVDMRKEKDES